MVESLYDEFQKTEPSPKVTDRHRGLIRVLHVDDDINQLIITKRFIEELDTRIHVEPISSPVEALDKVSSFDCVVSDYVMPEMNGIELVLRLKETVSLPFILYTGEGSEEVAERAFAAGVDDYIKKEFDLSHYQVLVKRITMAAEKYQAARARNIYEEQLRSLHFHAAKLNNIESLDEVFRITYEAMDKTLGFDVIDVIKIEDEMLSDVFVKGPGRDPFTLSMNGVGVTVRAARTCEPQYVPDVTQDPDYVQGRDGGMASEFAVPIIVEDKAVAVLNVESDQFDAFTSRDRELLETLAFHMSSAFTRLRKQFDRVTYEKRLEALHKHATTLVSAKNIMEVAKATMNAISSVLGFRRGSFAIVEDDQLRFIFVEGLETWEPFSLSLNGHGITVKAVRTGKTQLVQDVRVNEDFILRPGGMTYGSLSELDVPIVIQDKSVGVINIECERLDAFTLQDQQLVEILAMHVGSALERLEQLDILKKMVEEKTQEILDAERMVAAGRVASMVGHDLRGPMQTISNALYLMEMSSENNDELVFIIKEAIQRSTEMLEELRNQTHDSPISFISLDLAELLDSLVKGIQIPDGVKLIKRVEDNLEAVLLDHSKIRRVLDNLVENALDAMHDGGVLTLDAGIADENVVIKVSDTGFGIPDEEMGCLFKPFHTTKNEGMGLGLAYSKRAVEAHGGTLTVESKLGVGTTFTVTIPTLKT